MMYSNPNPSPRQPVGKRDQPPSPAYSPRNDYGFTGSIYTKTKFDGFNKRQNSQMSPMYSQVPHHERLKQEVASKMNNNYQPKNQYPLTKMLEATGYRSSAGDDEGEMEEQRPNDANVNSHMSGDINSKKSNGNYSNKNGADADDEIGGGRWSKEEDMRLKQGVQAIGATKWKRISEEYLGGKRSDVQCLHRWQKVLRPGLVKGPWTEEEDNIIRQCIRDKVLKWSEIADKIPGRIGKQCRERWFNHLDPSIDHSPWTEEEEKVLVTAQAAYGNRWCEIAKLLPGRPENAVKNRWNSAIRKKWQMRLGLTVTDNKGKACKDQPPKVANPVPLPPLEPVKKEHMNTSGNDAYGTVHNVMSGMDYRQRQVNEPPPMQKNPRKPSATTKKKQTPQRDVGMRAGNEARPHYAGIKVDTQGNGNNSHDMLCMTPGMMMVSPSNAGLQWDFHGDGTYDTNEGGHLSLDMNGISDIFGLPSVGLPSLNSVPRPASSGSRRLPAPLVSPAPLNVSVWDNVNPAELDKGMVSLSIFDQESFDNLMGPRTDDSFGEAAYFK